MQYVSPARHPREKRVSTPSWSAMRRNCGAQVGFSSMSTVSCFFMMRVSTSSYASARSDSSSIVSARPVGTRKKK